MLFEIRHVTEYEYDEPVRESMMELRLRPRRAADQRVMNFELEIDPRAQTFSYDDNFGNTVHHFDVPQAHSRLVIIANSLVETMPAAPPPSALDQGAWARLDSDAVRADWFDFLRPHGFASETPALTAFIRKREIAALRRHDPLTALTALMRTLYQCFDYESGVTGADSPIDHALVEGRGVCQDFAHIMIAICRGWGVPARYVSGYLFTNRALGDRSDPEHTHAWVEAFLPSLGWVGFDPTNNMIVHDRHISIAMGRDYADVPPSRGVFKGEAESKLSVGVQVRQAQASADVSEYLRMSAPAIAAARRRATSAALFHQQQQQQQ
jgi:transglutaminase-like putative cysteine protease